MQISATSQNEKQLDGLMQRSKSEPKRRDDYVRDAQDKERPHDLNKADRADDPKFEEHLNKQDGKQPQTGQDAKPDTENDPAAIDMAKIAAPAADAASLSAIAEEFLALLADGQLPEEVVANLGTEADVDSMLAELGLQQLPDGQIVPLETTQLTVDNEAITGVQQHDGTTNHGQQIEADVRTAPVVEQSETTDDATIVGQQATAGLTGPSKTSGEIQTVETDAGDDQLLHNQTTQTISAQAFGAGQQSNQFNNNDGSRFMAGPEESLLPQTNSSTTASPMFSLAEPDLLAGNTTGTVQTNTNANGTINIASLMQIEEVETAMDRTIGQQVAKAVMQELPDGQKLLSLRLTPPELGTVRVQIVENAGNVQVKMSAEDDGVRAALERALPSLRQELRQSETQVNDISMADHFLQFHDDGQADQEQQAGENKSSRNGGGRFSLDGEFETDDPLLTSQTTHNVVADDMVDTLA